jgi:hypothetical protein
VGFVADGLVAVGAGGRFVGQVPECAERLA